MNVLRLIRQVCDWWKILKLDESCTSNPKPEISNWTGRTARSESNRIFWILDLKCRIRPISKFLFPFGLLVHHGDRQLRRILSRMMDRVMRDDSLHLIIVLTAGVQIAVEAREVAA